ncbi:MAG: acyl-CoA desaturase [Bacteroidales bacterium]|nr:acyl-CoA desaturase [Bacteroidales bacterium]
MKSRIDFSNSINPEFFDTLRNKVNEYFQVNRISRFGNYHMVIKTIVMLSIYFIPYALMVSGVITNPWLILVMWIIMGFGMAGIGLSIMHDANHGSYSRNKVVNTIFGYFINLVGGSVTNWKIQHNVLHHSYTNIEGHDEDITTVPILRFAPGQKKFKIHHYQHIYAWFLYSLMTLAWFAYNDIPRLLRYKKRKQVKNHKLKFGWIMAELIFFKIFYAFYIILIPLLVLDIPWWATLGLFFIMQAICGLLLTTIFQLAHIMPTSEFPVPDSKGRIQNSWAIHQLHTTTNFSPNSRIFSWYIGGLNYQIEHHLFPNICHVHYRNISKIIKSTALEYGMPYHSQSNFITAIISHFKMLKMMGRAPVSLG